MNELALFAGSGGGLLGSKLLGYRIVCYVENDPYCVQVIQQRIRDGILDSMALTSYANAMRYLGGIGLIKIDREFGRRVIGRVAR